MPKMKKYCGVIVPMITPFTDDGEIDLTAVTKITNYLISQGTSPFILGTTGESASIPQHFMEKYVNTLVKTSEGRALTYAGISGNCLDTSIESAKRCLDLGIDVVVAHPPGYYPLKDHHLLTYYETLIESISGKLILYNIPSVTGISLPLDVVEKLSTHPRIVGLKDSERDLNRLHESIERWSNRDDFCHLIGWATQSANCLLRGSDGLVPSTGNLVPDMFKNLYNAATNGDREIANRLQKQTDEIARIYQKGFILSESLTALKIMMNEIGLCEDHVLPPLKRLSADQEKIIRVKTRELCNLYKTFDKLETLNINV